MKALDEFILMAALWLLLKRVHFLAFKKIIWTENMAVKWFSIAERKVAADQTLV